jgi:hypothetical protein
MRAENPSRRISRNGKGRTKMPAVKKKKNVPLWAREPDPLEPPLTPEEEEAFETGRKNVQRKDCLTLEEFIEQVSLL